MLLLSYVVLVAILLSQYVVTIVCSTAAYIPVQGRAQHLVQCSVVCQDVRMYYSCTCSISVLLSSHQY